MSSVIAEIGAGLYHRSGFLLYVLIIALVIGEPLAKLLRFPLLRDRLAAIIVRLGEKLNRTKRSVAIRLYRGIVALTMLLIPAVVFGIWLSQSVDWIRLLALLILIALFGDAIRPYSIFRRWRAAKRGTLTLQTNDYLYTDTHAVIRHSILADNERFATAIIGGSIAFLLGGIAGLFAWLTVAAAASYYTTDQSDYRAFGWAAHYLYAGLAIPVHGIAGLILWFAACFTPRTTPIAALHHLPKSASHFYGWVAYLTNISLGGTLPRPSGELTLPWRGAGSPKPTVSEYSRSIMLIALALFIWIALLWATKNLLVIDFNIENRRISAVA